MSNNKKGFGGLGNLVSDISEDIAPQPSVVTPKLLLNEQKATPQPPEPPKQPSPPPVAPVAPTPQQTSSTAASTPSAVPSPPSGNGTIRWVIGIVAAISILVMISSNDNKSPSGPASPSSNFSAPAPVSQPSLDVEMPPVGENQTLGTKQIRYCTYEKTRIDAIESLVSNSNSSDVSKFNGLVADYNSRCSSFRYRSGELQRIEAEIAQNRLAIENKARTEWMQQYKETSSTSVPSSSPSNFAATNGKREASQTCTVDQDCQGTLMCISGRCAPPAWQGQSQTTTKPYQAQATDTQHSPRSKPDRRQASKQDGYYDPPPVQRAPATPTSSYLGSIRGGNLPAVEYYLNNNVSPNDPLANGATPLKNAVVTYNLSVAELLISRGADVNERDGAGKTVLTWAKGSNNSSMIALLKRNGAVE